MTTTQHAPVEVPTHHAAGNRSALDTDISTTRAALADTVEALTAKLDLGARAQRAAATAKATTTRYLRKAAPVARRAGDRRVLASAAGSVALAVGWVLATRRERARRWDREVVRRWRQR